jgi:hypothetical protein
MTKPIVWADPTVRVGVVPPGTHDRDGRRSEGWTLALNSPTGILILDAKDRGRAALFTLVERMWRELVSACIGEHAQGLHTSPEPGCPRCEDDQCDLPAEQIARTSRVPYAELAARAAAVGLPAPAPAIGGGR